MLINKKSKIPVLFASRDKGGLYVIKPEYLPVLRLLDRCIREEFAKVSQHQRNVVKVGGMKFNSKDNCMRTHFIWPYMATLSMIS